MRCREPSVPKKGINSIKLRRVISNESSITLYGPGGLLTKRELHVIN